MFFHVLVEGVSDVPTVGEILRRQIGLTAGTHFRVYPHKGKGRIPDDPDVKPDPKDESLLGLLPAKLRAYGKASRDHCVIVLIDADRDNCLKLKKSIVALWHGVTPRPKNVLVRIAVEEMESWFIADRAAIKAAYSTANFKPLKGVRPDEVVGAWERLAECLGLDPKQCTGADKEEWAQNISPHLNLKNPPSPSLRAFVKGVTKHWPQ